VQIIIILFYLTGDSLYSSTGITIELLDVNDNPPIIQNGGGVLRTIAEDEAKPVMHLHLSTETFMFRYNVNDTDTWVY
jgi:hypothetical protein